MLTRLVAVVLLSHSTILHSSHGAPLCCALLLGNTLCTLACSRAFHCLLSSPVHSTSLPNGSTRCCGLAASRSCVTCVSRTFQCHCPLPPAIAAAAAPPRPPPGRRHVPVCVHPRGDAATDCVGKVCRHPCAPAVAAAGHAHAHGGAVADRPPPRHRPRGGAVARRPRCGDRVQVVRRHCGLRRGLSVGAYRDRAWQTPRRSSPSPPPFPPPRGGSPWDLSMCNRLFLCVGPPTAVRHGGATASLHGALVPDAGLAGQSPSSSCKPFSLLFFRSHEYSCTGGRYARAQPAMQVISIEWCLSGQREF